MNLLGSLITIFLHDETLKDGMAMLIEPQAHRLGVLIGGKGKKQRRKFLFPHHH